MFFSLLLCEYVRTSSFESDRYRDTDKMCGTVFTCLVACINIDWAVCLKITGVSHSARCYYSYLIVPLHKRNVNTINVGYARPIRKLESLSRIYQFDSVFMVVCDEMCKIYVRLCVFVFASDLVILSRYPRMNLRISGNKNSQLMLSIDNSSNIRIHTFIPKISTILHKQSRTQTQTHLFHHHFTYITSRIEHLTIQMYCLPLYLSFVMCEPIMKLCVTMPFRAKWGKIM